MSIVNLIILIVVSILISDLISEKTEDVMPPVVFLLLLILYGTAILGKAHHSYQGTLILFALIFIFYFIKKRRLFPDKAFLGEKVFTAGFITYLVLVAIMFIAYSNHFVLVWDDFHYNATFPKDMYYYGAMPSGNHSATFYRSYPPLMQLFFYWGFQGIGGFSEPLMFEYKMFLIYTCMLPLIKRVGSGTSRMRMIMTAVVSAALPFLFMYELMESLSMDTFMALLFGYALINIMEEKNDRFRVTRIILSLACLTLVKQIAPIFTAIALAAWAAMELGAFLSKKDDEHRKPETVQLLITALVTAGCYLSWKIFCDRHGNSVYLSGKLSSSLSGGGFRLPDYGSETIVNYLKDEAVLHLDLAANGLTLFCSVIIAGAVAYLMLKQRGGSRVKWALIVIFAGLLGYLTVILYTYLFVFEDWEAKSLSSVDRYFGTYALTLMYLACVWATIAGEDPAGDNKGRETPVYKWLLPAMTLISLLCFPWKFSYDNLIPPVYEKNHAGAREELKKVIDEVSPVSVKDLEVRKVMVVSNETNTLYSRGMVYNLIPLIPDEFIATGGDDLSAQLLDKCREDNVYYVYFAGRLCEDESIKSILGAVDESVEIAPGNIYIYDEERNVITGADDNG